MRIVLHAPGGDRDLDVRIDRPDATVGDLARAIDRHVHAGPDAPGPEPAGLTIEGLWTPADLPIDEAGLHEGATVVSGSLGAATTLGSPGIGATGSAGATGARRPLEAVGGSRVELGVVAGPLAGRRIPLAEGSTEVGRDPACPICLPDVTVSRVHCRIDVGPDGSATITNLSTSAGTLVDGAAIEAPTALAHDAVITLGALELCVRPLVTDDRPLGIDRFRDLTAAATLNLNRPPRVMVTRATPTVDAPEEPKNAHKAPFNMTMIIAPLPVALMMYLLTKQIYMVAMAAMSPVMALGNWWESKHKSKRALRKGTREYHEQLERLDEQLAEARTRDIAERRAARPDPAEVVRRATLPSVRLWERRPEHDDFLHLSAGLADLPFSPTIKTATASGSMPSEVTERVAAAQVLPRVPAEVDLADGGVIGIAGDLGRATAVARGLVCQAAVHHGPADLRIAVVSVDADATEWDWAKWLPHTRDQRVSAGERHLLAAGTRAVDELLDALIADESAAAATRRRGEPAGATTLFVIDGDELLAGRTSLTRQALRGGAGPAAGIVIAPTVDRLPAVCTTILDVNELGEAGMIQPRVGQHRQPVLAAGMEETTAREVALGLARFDDPEIWVAGAALPELVHLLPLLEFDALTDEAVARRWDAATARRDLRAPIGLMESGPFVLDFDRHGPHGLIGGTTGSGKSELLKTLVAAFAATYPPTELTFGLFDFKGGATFNEFADLPHTVGMASDLDVHLAKRALRCLRAELLHREHLFDAAQAKDLVELDERQQRGDAAALAVGKVPRLIVIIDEFAAMAKELSGEIGSLADLTARGRSLGVHLLLATQKPSGAVNAEIKTNTRLRISLLVEDKQDSVDVIGIPDAADVGLKGRAYFRVGQGEVVPIQTALSTATGDTDSVPAVEVAPFRFATQPVAARRPRPRADLPSDLERLVDSMRRVFTSSSAAPPRRPWPEPLPDVLPLADLRITGSAPPDEDAILFALADDPEAQTRYPVGWALDQGNLLLYGIVGSGTTTALASLAIAAVTNPPDGRDVHLYALDFGAGELGALARLPHTGAVVGAADRERQVRLIRWLRAEVERRQALDPVERAHQSRLLVLVDNFEAVRASFDDAAGMAVFEALQRVYADGPETGINVAVTASRVGGVPAALASATVNKVGFRLGDANDYSMLGLRRDQFPTASVPGRAVLAGTGREIHVALPGPTLDAAVDDVVAAGHRPGRVPTTIDALPTEVPLERVVEVSRVEPERWVLGVGIGDATLAPVGVVLYENEHATVAGPARSGKSSTLLALGSSLRAAQPDAVVLGIARRRSPLRDHPLLDAVATTDDEVASVLDGAMVATKPTLVLIDDADGVDDTGGRINQLLLAGLPHVRVAIAGRPELLRSLYGHWTQVVRRSKAGVLLQPNLDLDGELLGATLPRRLHVAMQTGRGFVVADGHGELVQVAH